MTVPENILHLDEVENWDDHMNSANYSAQQRSFIKQANEKKDYAMQFLQNNEWELLYKDEAEQLETHITTSKNGLLSIKGRIDCGHPFM